MPQIQVMRIERVVEVEDPGLDMLETGLAEVARRLLHHSNSLLPQFVAKETPFR